jgi:hypothetical protein
MKARPEHYLMCARRRAGRDCAADRPELPRICRTFFGF